MIRSLYRDFIDGILSHKRVSLTGSHMILLLYIFMIYDNMYSFIMSVDVAILTLLLIQVYNVRKFVSTILRFAFARAITWWFIYTIWNQWDIEYILPFIIGVPILISWYIFEPFLLPYRRFSTSDRFDYFLSRFPYFMGFGTIPTFIMCIILMFEPARWLYIIMYICVLKVLSHINDDSAPNYARNIPYTKNTYATNPIDMLEDWLNDV